ncbi:MAG: M23 family metallopeptidase [Firmicutes bacterium]|nr:M23 family metallopeptidase [Bacillota bacterium]
MGRKLLPLAKLGPFLPKLAKNKPAQFNLLKPRLSGQAAQPKRLVWVLERCGFPPWLAPALIVRLVAMVIIVVALVSLGTLEPLGDYLHGLLSFTQRQDINNIETSVPAVTNPDTKTTTDDVTGLNSTATAENITKNERAKAPGAEAAKPTAMIEAKTHAVNPTKAQSPKTCVAATVLPVTGEIIREFGLTYSPTFADYRYHPGLDFAAGQGTPVKATGSGQVVSVIENKDEGVVLIIDHGQGWRSRYAHCAEPKVKKGQTLKAGQTIAVIGPPGRLEAVEGPHLHYELIYNGQPINPKQYLK